LSSLDTSHVSKTEFIKYDVKNMSSAFCCSDEIFDRVTETINSLESHEVLHNEDNDGLISSNKERSGIDLTSNPVICSPIFVIKSVARTTLKS
jgi:hypothetical protein